MANSKASIIELPEDDEEDLEFLHQLEAAEAQALSLSSSKRRRISVDSLSHSKSDNSVEQIEEGAYTAALKGSKSITWQKHQHQQQQQQSSVAKFSDASAITTVGGSGGSGACFRCGKEGHWARDCPQSTSSSSVPSSANVAVVEKACPCGLGNCLLLTANTERNRGRKFFRCPVRQENGGCGFFEWYDETAEKCTSAEGERAWKNGGQQQFYQHPTNQAASGYTKSWNDFDKGTSAPNFGYGQKFDSSDNKAYGYGQQFGSTDNKAYGYGQKFESTDNKAYGYDQKFESTDNKAYGYDQKFESTGMRSGSSCFKCGQEGHWARDCPTTSSNVTAGARGNPSSNACYKCGQSGHWAKDCSEGQSTKLRSW
ncbi:uncharacterized protein LOC104902642 [Beta vulgaris subsp. vulgaris]|uniref:uncharacterized protein LOC104902642 n=1 Tax=Beta vulgaris subsp. vulgaris TaxID=3555 RepID=UPI00203703A2|nr:uncharacterized protein LOC104902642 [Beta vulgaris subsp. vulgaris]